MTSFDGIQMYAKYRKSFVKKNDRGAYDIEIRASPNAQNYKLFYIHIKNLPINVGLIDVK